MQESDWYAWLLSKPKVGSVQIIALKEWLDRTAIPWQEVMQGKTRSPLTSKIAPYLSGNAEPEVVEHAHKLNEQGIEYLAWFDSYYPDSLAAIPDHPALLFWQSKTYTKHHWAAVCEHTVAVVGTRRHSVYSETVTQQIVEQMALYGVTIVSGLALGIDAVAHRSTLKQGGVTIAVVAGGIGQHHPRSNHSLYESIWEKGVVCAEFPPQAEQVLFTGSFPMRNRIIAGLSRAIVVTEAPIGSGAVVTAKLGISYSRDVFIVPSDIDRHTNTGALEMAQRGEAGVILSGHDLINQLAWTHLQKKYARQKRKSLIRRLRKCVGEYSSQPFPKFNSRVTVEHFLIDVCQIPLPQLPLVLLKLKMYGIITRSLKGQYLWQLR